MKFKVYLLLIFTIGLLICLFIDSEILAKQHHKVTVVMFGDSLTERGKWNKLFPHTKIINLGVSGDTTKKMKRRLYDVYRHNPDYCFIMAGFNDIDQDRDLNKIYYDYFSILEKLQYNGITPIIISTTYAMESFRPNDQINTNIDTLNNTLKEYASNNDLIFINLNNYIAKNHSLSPEFSVEHVHINEKAYEIWKEQIKNIIYKNQE